MGSPSHHSDSRTDNLADEKATGLQEQSVPGDSPAYYTGDPSTDVLEIESLDLMPNPPMDHFNLQLRGEIKQEIGLDPQLYISVYLNGRRGPRQEQKLCADNKIVIVQRGGPLPRGEAPTVGKVVISYQNFLPYTWLKKGWYTVRVEMYAGEKGGKARMTGFEGGVWVEGEKGDGCGGWV